MAATITGRGWAYTGALLGGAVSIAANVAHSYVPPPEAPAGWTPHTGAVVGAVFWPLALFVAVEIFARIAWPTGRRWTALRFLGLLPVALVAAVVSYRHLSGLLAFYREDPLTATIGPLAVDGLMVMATGALIATGTRRLTATVTTLGVPVTQSQPVDPAPEPAAPPAVPDADPVARPRPARKPTKTDTATAARRLRQRHPEMTVTDIARRLGVTDRTVRRHLNTTPDTAPARPVEPVPAAA